MGEFEADIWEARVRRAFWIIGLLLGALLTYTTRYFLNGDGINYIEMGEALRNGAWSGLVNLTESPAYAFLLGLGHIVLDTNTLAENGRDVTELGNLAGLEPVYDVEEWKVYSLEPLIR